MFASRNHEGWKEQEMLAKDKNFHLGPCGNLRPEFLTCESESSIK
jgi:hypothetical protein